MNTDTPRRSLHALRTAGACLLVSTLLAIAGCASKDTSRSGLFEPYRIDLPQGNYLTREQVDQVREGMTRDQVRFALGTPLLGHVFHRDRWDYVFSFKHPNGRVELRNVTVRFENDRVSAIEADPLPEREDANDPALPGYRPSTAQQQES
jgi:outer membrane protein assembly factor BamE